MKQGYRYQRERMVRCLRDQGIRDERVLDVMREIPRHHFVRAQFLAKAYGSYTLPIGASQTISRPYIVARMSELLELDSAHRVLEIGTGSGYQTAILASLSRWVFSLERVPSLASAAIDRLRELGFDNVKIQIFDGTVGWGKAAPFDRILVTAGAPRVPQPLLQQLGEEGVLVLPEGERRTQRLIIYRREGERFLRHEGESVGFVPLIGRHSWPS